MNAYEYLAYSQDVDIDALVNLCEKYGYYNLQYRDQIPKCLVSIVSEHGEPAFKEMMQLHPDKEVLLELFEKKVEVEVEVEKPEIKPMQERDRERDCSCMMNASGQTQSQGLATQTNMIILVAAMLVSISIISMRGK